MLDAEINQNRVMNEDYEKQLLAGCKTSIFYGKKPPFFMEQNLHFLWKYFTAARQNSFSSDWCFSENPRPTTFFLNKRNKPTFL